jgi:NO-binding membrane sensor protein with MHYT domain
MSFVYELIVVLHFIGLASLVGGFMVQMSATEKAINPAMLHGALTQLVTGIALVGLAESGAVDEELNMTKVSIKLIIALAVAAIAFIGRKRSGNQASLWGAAGGLALINIVIAVFI